MTSAKRGKNVWACGICGYWSPRAKNVERHNISIHAGSAIVVPAYATLVVEPSYKITPLGFPGAPMVAHDTTTTTSMFTGSPTTTIDAPKKKPFSAAEIVDSDFEKYIKPILDVQKAVNRMNRALGTASFYYSPSPQGVAALSTYYTSSFKPEGYMGTVCDKCFAHVIMPIPFSTRPEDYKPSIESVHNCKGEKTFPSETARQQAHSSMVDELFSKVKEWVKDNVIMLRTERLDGYVPQSSTLIHEIKLETDDLSKRKAAEAGPLDDTELKAFLTEVRSTIGIFKITDASRTSQYYRYIVWGIPREMLGTTPAAVGGGGTSNNDGSSASGLAAVAKNTEATEKDGTEEGDKEEQQQQDTIAAAPKESTGIAMANDPSSKGNPGRTAGQIAATAAPPQIGGVQLAVCEECCNAYVAPITILRNLEFEKSLHVKCPGKVKFESEDARLEHISKSKRNGIDTLYKLATTDLKYTALYAQKIDPPDPSLKGNLTLHDGKNPAHYISRAVRDGITPVNKSELLDFLTCNNSSCGYYGILPSGEQYFISAISSGQGNEAK